MRRREFIAALGSAAAWPLLAHAQQDRVRRIGVLMPYTKDDPEDQQRVAAFQEGLKRSGWIEGRNIQSDRASIVGMPVTLIEHNPRQGNWSV